MALVYPVSPELEYRLKSVSHDNRSAKESQSGAFPADSDPISFQAYACNLKYFIFTREATEICMQMI
jgi:hypothetical protein